MTTDPRLQASASAARAAGLRLFQIGPLAVARMAGSSIAEPSASGWVSDFLNAAYYARKRDESQVDDLRMAISVLTTAWHRWGRRLRLGDLKAFHGAFGSERLERARTRRGTLGREALLAGGDRLLGGDFAAGYSDPELRGWGIVFAGAAERDAFEPQRRLAGGVLRELTPPERPPAEQTWHTYDPVALPSAERALAVLEATERWPDFGTELGCFTAVRREELLGQTFEIELAARITPRTPVFMRAYVTATRVLAREGDRDELETYIAGLERDMPADGRPLPPGARPLALAELTTHKGHFLGRGISRFLLFDHGGAAFIRDIGSWDPLPLHLAIPYRLGGNRAQRAFWGAGSPEQSVFDQLAALSA